MGNALHNAVERFHQPQGPLRETLREGKALKPIRSRDLPNP